MEDALISPESFAILSGAGLIAATAGAPIYVHTTSQIEVEKANEIKLPNEACWNRYDDTDEFYHNGADIFVMTMTDGQIDSEPCIPAKVAEDHKTLTCYGHAGQIDKGDIVLVDYYIKKTNGAQLIEITADKFGGNYYLEASTLFRDEQSGVDMPAEFIIPNCKVQSNFTFTMAATGDPSTFTFTMDAFPDYTKFDRTHKVLAAIQVITEAIDTVDDGRDPCTEQNVIGGTTRTVTITYDNTSNRKATKVTITGNNIKPFSRQEMINAGFASSETEPKFPDNFQMMTVNIELPVEEGKTYSLVTRSPMHKYYYKEDGSRDSRIIKDKDGLYKKQSITTKNVPITTAITNEDGPITFTLYEVDDGVETLIKTISVTNKVRFA